MDTHVLLWWLDGQKTLSEKAFRAIQEGSHIVFVSAATAWEISIKQTLGKLQAPQSLEEALAANQFLPLSITLPHALLAGRLPPHHEDPFDRLLIAQASIEKLTLVTRDQKQRLYDIQTLWA